MQGSTRIASAAVAAALMVGVAGPAPSAHAATTAHAKHAAVAQVKSAKEAKTAKAAAKDKRLVRQGSAPLDTALGKSAASVRASKVGTKRKAPVLANVAADRAGPASLAQ